MESRVAVGTGRPSGHTRDLQLAERFFEDHTRMLVEATMRPEALDLLAVREASAEPDNPHLVLNMRALAVGVLSKSGEILAQSPEFVADQIAGLIDDQCVLQALKTGRTAFQILTERPHALCYVPAAKLGSWTLPPAIATALGGPNRVAVFAERLGQKGAISRACEALGLSPNHIRILDETIRAGNILRASANASVSYQHARATVAEALAISGCESVHQLISHIARQTFGLMPDDPAPAAQLLMEIWGLTPRQSELALLIGDGQSRADAARFLRISEATVKKELNRIYEALEISSVTELAPKLAALRLHGILMQHNATRGELSELGGVPLRFCRDEDGRRIAFSDFGPQGAFPVYYIHSSMTSRIIPRDMQTGLAERGFRVIAIDRPGFGLTDTASTRQWEVAALDFCHVQRALGLAGGIAIARGGAQLLLELARIAPASLEGAVLLNPDPRSTQSSKRQGPLGAVKEYFLRSPGMIRTAAILTARQLSPERLARWLEKSVASSSADLAALARPGMAEDYWRAVRSLSTGRVDGYVAEQVDHVVSKDIPLTERPWPCRILIGGQDMLHDPAEAIRHWTTVIPGSEARLVEDAGRLLSFSHLSLVLEEITTLREAIERGRRPVQ